jgi:4-azaleucine resistance transporter AzlC
MLNKDFTEGIKRVFPLFIGVIPFGLAYGISANSAGLLLKETAFMSLTVFAGAAQFVAVEMIRQKSTILFIVIMTLIINLRHILMSLSLKSYLKGVNKIKTSLIAFGIHDESYAVSSIYFKEKNRGSLNFLFSASLLMYIGWVGSSILGYTLGSQIGDPLKWGLDFAMPATFIGILIPTIKNFKIFAVVIVAGITAIFFKLIIGGSYYIILASIAGTITGYALERLKK